MESRLTITYLELSEAIDEYILNSVPPLSENKINLLKKRLEDYYNMNDFEHCVIHCLDNPDRDKLFDCVLEGFINGAFTEPEANK